LGEKSNEMIMMIAKSYELNASYDAKVTDHA